MQGTWSVRLPYELCNIKIGDRATPWPWTLKNKIGIHVGTENNKGYRTEGQQNKDLPFYCTVNPAKRKIPYSLAELEFELVIRYYTVISQN